MPRGKCQLPGLNGGFLQENGGNGKDYLSYHIGQPFTTIDQDNDADIKRQCAIEFQGAWWYKNCYQSNLNGLNLGHLSTSAKGLKWGSGYTLESCQMAIRPKLEKCKVDADCPKGEQCYSNGECRTKCFKQMPWTCKGMKDFWVGKK